MASTFATWFPFVACFVLLAFAAVPVVAVGEESCRSWHCCHFHCRIAAAAAVPTGEVQSVLHETCVVRLRIPALVSHVFLPTCPIVVAISLPFHLQLQLLHPLFFMKQQSELSCLPKLSEGDSLIMESSTAEPPSEL